MNCYVCAEDGLESVAVAVCPHCGAALCMQHVRQEASAAMPGGMHDTCTHDTWTRVASVDH